MKKDGAALLSIEETEKLWHNRLGHANERSILELARKGAVVGLDLHLNRTSSCVACLKGKQHKLSLDCKPEKSKSAGDIIDV